jgi:hypothetical protein
MPIVSALRGVRALDVGWCEVAAAWVKGKRVPCHGSV